MWKKTCNSNDIEEDMQQNILYELQDAHILNIFKDILSIYMLNHLIYHLSHNKKEDKVLQQRLVSFS
jgi:hypothetical protein